MDFTNRSPATQQQQQQQSAQNQNPQFGSPQQSSNKKRNQKKNNLTKWGTFGLGVIVVILLIAVVIAVGFSQPKSQASYVYTNKLQAVFLNTGQVYFGNITTINPQYLVLTNIFYLQTNSTKSSSSTSSTNSNVSLVKLGCELHAPYDQMVINMPQVTFWENLKSTGQVAKAVAQYQKEYPHGQVCSTNSQTGSTTTAPTSSSVQNAPTSTNSSVTKKP